MSNPENATFGQWLFKEGGILVVPSLDGCILRNISPAS